MCQAPWAHHSRSTHAKARPRVRRAWFRLWRAPHRGTTLGRHHVPCHSTTECATCDHRPDTTPATGHRARLAHTAARSWVHRFRTTFSSCLDAGRLGTRRCSPSSHPHATLRRGLASCPSARCGAEPRHRSHTNAGRGRDRAADQPQRAWCTRSSPAVRRRTAIARRPQADRRTLAPTRAGPTPERLCCAQANRGLVQAQPRDAPTAAGWEDPAER